MTNNPNTNDPKSDSISDQASRSTLALNPLVGLRGQDLVDSSIILLNAIAREPAVAVNQFLGFLGEMGNVVSGNSERKPEAGDKRFADKTWKDSAVHRRLLQAYLAWGDSVNKFIDQTSLSDINKTRAHLIASMLVDAAAPTNNLLSNPAALRHFFDTGGKSLWQGINNFLEDLGKNGGLPSQVDKSPFKVGENLATTPGAVVFQNETLELIQYVPTTPNVRRRPLVITPPQINKFYSLDLTPEKSLLQFLLKSGIQVFCVSWRNPTAEHRDWGLDTYLVALDEAVDATMEITGSEDISMMGACSGGITSSAYLGMLAGKGQRKVRNIVLAVCVLDVAAPTDSQFMSLVTPETMEAAKAASHVRGVLDGGELARVFAWMRPNDLIWNYWVNNYLFGNSPPAFDILFWNADTTCLPARLHHDYVDLYHTNPFVNANRLTLNGAAIDMKRVQVDSYVVAGVTDHITPWKAVYQTAKIYGDDATFVLSNSGHLQAILNPPTNLKSSCMSGLAKAPDADGFLATAEKKNGSWWPHWLDWLTERSGEDIQAPAELGSARHPAGAPAPGTYVFD